MDKIYVFFEWSSQMKVAIITMHGSHNCGSMLQSYAFQKTLNTWGIDNRIINYRSSRQKKMYALLRTPSNMHDILYDLMKISHYNKFHQHYVDYEFFLNKYLKLTDKEYSAISELEELENYFDIFIAGSDQIWNVLCDDASDAYFLNFINSKKKIAYAPSFGVTDINYRVDNAQKYKKYISNFNCLSVRENNGAKWIKELTNRDAKVVLDPVMLIHKSDYEELIKHSEYKEKDIFFIMRFLIRIKSIF